MKRRKRASRRQATLKGWWKALPFLLIPFGAFLTETWLHTEILTNGYRDWDLIGEIRVLKENIVQLEADLSRKTNVGTIDQQAKDAAPPQTFVPANSHGGVHRHRGGWIPLARPEPVTFARSEQAAHCTI